jgi:hypothetical protein
MARKPKKTKSQKPKRKKGQKRPTTKKKPDVRGYIMRSLDPEKTGWVEKGHLEGEDSLSAVPPETLAEWRGIMASGKAKITVRRVKDDPRSFDVNMREIEEDPDAST